MFDKSKDTKDTPDDEASLENEDVMDVSDSMTMYKIKKLIEYSEIGYRGESRGGAYDCNIPSIDG